MRKLVILLALGVLTLFGGATSAGATTLGHHPLYMPNASNMTNPTLQPPPVCCAPTGPPVAGEPAPVNMAYFGGHVQVTPVIYLVFWGWGQAGAFDHTTAGMPTNDPDGAAARMTAFVKAMGGTAWAGSQTQYYETVNGQNINIQNPTNVFGGAETIHHKYEVIREHCAAIGRDPDEIERSTLQGVRLALEPGGKGESPQEVVDRFGELSDAGAQHVIFSVADVWDARTIEIVGRDVIPALHALGD